MIDSACVVDLPSNIGLHRLIKIENIFYLLSKQTILGDPRWSSGLECQFFRLASHFESGGLQLDSPPGPMDFCWVPSNLSRVPSI